MFEGRNIYPIAGQIEGLIRRKVNEGQDRNTGYMLCNVFEAKRAVITSKNGNLSVDEKLGRR